MLTARSIHASPFHLTRLFLLGALSALCLASASSGAPQRSGISLSPPPGADDGSTAGEGIFVALPPQVYARSKGRSVPQVTSFRVLNPDTAYTLELTNGTEDLGRVSSATVEVNGVEIFGPQDFNQQVSRLEAPIRLQVDNVLTVDISQPVRSGLSIRILGVDLQAPVITATVTPPPNAAGWNREDVTVTFECDDAISGVRSCSEPIRITEEGAGQRVVGTVVDNAGNRTTVEVVVNLDETAPVLDLTWPPEDHFHTDLSFIDVEGAATDGLSGIGSLVLTGAGGTELLSHPSFLSTQALNTGVTPQNPVAESFFTLDLLDAAGNRVTRSLQVDHTLLSTVVAVDESETEPIPGMQASYRQAFVVFEDFVSRPDTHAILAAYGGRTAGFLTALHASLVIFEGPTSVAELDAALVALEGDPAVKGVQLTGLLPSTSSTGFDNDALSSAGRIAYDDIRASDAVCYINANVAPASVLPVDVAVIDSGLDATFGRNNEFLGVQFVDYQNGMLVPGAPPVDLSGHGTAVTGVISGRNNGEGNNGVAQNVVGGAFTTTVYRANLRGGTSIDFNAISLAMDDIVANGSVDVVNMSFSYEASNAVSTSRATVYERAFSRSGGILWVAAAGNGGNDEIGDDLGCSGAIPAVLACTCPNVIAVAAHDPGTLTAAAYSNFGEAVEISAPGEQVFTAGSPGTYAFWHMTSFAAPQVAGAAALMSSIANLSGADRKDLLLASARPLPAARADGLDALEAVRLADLLRGGTLHQESGRIAGGVLRTIPKVWSTPPGLVGFAFNFVNDDHRIDEIRAEVGQDPASATDFVRVAYNDQNDDDLFTWSIKGISLPFGTTYGQVSGSSAGGSAISGPLFGTGRFVLTGFVVNFTSDDHNLDEFGISFGEDSGITRAIVTYNDQNDDDDFTWTVFYAAIPDAAVTGFGSTGRRGPVAGNDSVNIGIVGRPIVLSGFHADFEPVFTSGGDHHIDELSFDLLAGGTVRVEYNDKNDDDAFYWSADWVTFQ